MRGMGNAPVTARARVAAACRGEAVDHIPAGFWGHDYAAEQTFGGLAESTIRFQRAYGWDFIKINPRAQYHVEDWGVRYDYPDPAGSKCVRTDYPIHGPADYVRIRRLDPESSPVLAGHLQAVGKIAREFPDVPAIMTVFNPLSVLKYAAASEHAVVEHLRTHPQQVRAALDEVRETFLAFTRAALRRGAAGIFLATTAFATRDLWPYADYEKWSRADDLALLGAARDGNFNVVHVCRARNYLESLASYPAHAFSWAATEPGNAPIGATPYIQGGAIGGISQETSLQAPGPDAVTAEFRAALDASGGRRFLLGPGCSIPPETRPSNLHALRELSLGA